MKRVDKSSDILSDNLSKFKNKLNDYKTLKNNILKPYILRWQLLIIYKKIYKLSCPIGFDNNYSIYTIN